MKRLCHCLLLVLFVAVAIRAQSIVGDGEALRKVRAGELHLALQITKNEPETVFLKRTVSIGNNTYDYLVYLPQDFGPKNKYPVLLSLHGLRLTANDNEIQTPRGLRLEITRNPKQFNSFIAVFPQARVNSFWVGEMVAQAIKALDQTIAEFKADERRVYLMGASMGGYGAFYTAARYPGRFAALVAIWGGILPPGARNLPPQLRALVPPAMLKLYDAEDPYRAFAKAIGTTPTWIFHGTEDETVPVTESRKMAASLKAANGDVRFTEYPGKGHGLGVFTDADLWKWLLAQRLGK
jgi:predicted peptidase